MSEYLTYHRCPKCGKYSECDEADTVGDIHEGYCTYCREELPGMIVVSREDVLGKNAELLKCTHCGAALVDFYEQCKYCGFKRKSPVEEEAEKAVEQSYYVSTKSSSSSSYSGGGIFGDVITRPLFIIAGIVVLFTLLPVMTQVLNNSTATTNSTTTVGQALSEQIKILTNFGSTIVNILPYIAMAIFGILLVKAVHTLWRMRI